jgi:hypothetical protein
MRIPVKLIRNPGLRSLGEAIHDALQRTRFLLMFVAQSRKRFYSAFNVCRILRHVILLGRNVPTGITGAGSAKRQPPDFVESQPGVAPSDP